MVVFTDYYVKQYTSFILVRVFFERYEYFYQQGHNKLYKSDS